MAIAVDVAVDADGQTYAAGWALTVAPTG